MFRKLFHEKEKKTDDIVIDSPVVSDSISVVDEWKLDTLPENGCSIGSVQEMAMMNSAFTSHSDLPYCCIDDDKLIFKHVKVSIAKHIIQISKKIRPPGFDEVNHVEFLTQKQVMERLPIITLLRVNLSKLKLEKAPKTLRNATIMNVLTQTFSNLPAVLNQGILLTLDDANYLATVKHMETVDGDVIIGKKTSKGFIVSDITQIEYEWSVASLKYVSVQKEFSELARIMDSPLGFQSLGIGGLDEQLNQIFRRAFVSRRFPAETVKKLGCKHVKGILLYGPAGTGKTTIARKIGEILNVANPKIVNGPELLSKYVGESEKNMRILFEDAFKASHDDNSIHLVIFDEIDAICRARGTGDSTGARDGVVTQLLSLMDGVKALNNILIIGMTNRKDLIDEALLRPGRMEVHIEVGLPDEKGRLQILEIHTKSMRDNNMLAVDVDLETLARTTVNFTGAELEGLVRSAQSFSMMEHVKGINEIDDVDLKVSNLHFERALDEIRPMFGVPRVRWADYQRGGILDYLDNTNQHLPQQWVDWLNTDRKIPMRSLIIEGPHNTGCTAFASYIVQNAAGTIPCIKWLDPSKYFDYSETAKIKVLSDMFNQAFTCQQSLIVIDDVESFINFTDADRFSWPLLRHLRELCRQTPPTGHYCTLVCTTHQYDFLCSKEWDSIFSEHHTLPMIDDLTKLCALYKCDLSHISVPTTIKMIVRTLGVINE